MYDNEKSELARREALRLSNEEANKLTRDCLFEALLRLIRKKPFDKITVSELVRCAGVSRTAFYRNYSSIDEILRERFEGFVMISFKLFSVAERMLGIAILYYSSSERKNKKREHGSNNCFVLSF